MLNIAYTHASVVLVILHYHNICYEISNVRATHYTANSIKVVFSKAQTVNYERARDDGLLFI